MSAPAEALRRLVLDRTIALASVPAPTGEEGPRAGVVEGWWLADGLADVHRDSAGNVWGRARGGEGDAVVVAAHLDTVFAADVPHAPVLADGRLRGPGVGDDAVGLAALSAAAGLLGASGPPVWLLATVGEEGLGNLRGATAALETPPVPVGAFVAVEGNYLGRVSCLGVGSVRWRIRACGPGGHAWEARRVLSAVHAVATIAAGIAAIEPPPGTAVNVGRIGGGEGINVRAREAWCEVDLRAEDPAALEDLERTVGAIASGAPADLRVEHDLLGRRPAGRVPASHPLPDAAVAALDEAGIAAHMPATSTDANAAHARGIPAIAVGITTGSGEHTAEEWIDVEPIADGVEVLARTVERYGRTLR